MKPAELNQNPSEQKTAEALSLESRMIAPGGPFRNAESKSAGFYAKRMVCNVQWTVQNLSGAVQNLLI